MHISRNVRLPDIVKYGGFTYHLCNEPLKKGDWYICHQKYNWHYGSPVEDCDSDSLAKFINEERSGWYSRKIKFTDDPVINKSYL